MIDTDKWITVPQAAALTGYSPNYIRRLIRLKSIHAEKFGMVWAIDRQSLLAYQRQQNEIGAKRGPKG